MTTTDFASLVDEYDDVLDQPIGNGAMVHAPPSGSSSTMAAVLASVRGFVRDDEHLRRQAIKAGQRLGERGFYRWEQGGKVISGASIDLIEDLAIAYGYDNIPRKLVPSMTVASERPERILANQVRTTLTGLGFFEAMSLLLSNPEEQYEVLGLDDPGDAVRVAHPVSVEQTMLRTSLMPQLLTLFSLNRGQGLPQRLFEVDDAILLPPGQERPTEALHVTAGLLDMTAGFADIKAVAEALARELRIELTYAPVDHPAFIPGRVASISWDGTPLGLAGEIHPRVLERCRLAQPLAVLELDLQPMLGGKGRG